MGYLQRAILDYSVQWDRKRLSLSIELKCANHILACKNRASAIEQQGLSKEEAAAILLLDIDAVKTVKPYIANGK